MVTLSEALKMNRRELLAVALTSTAATVTHAQTPSPADFRQLLAGRDETIIEPEIPTHIIICSSDPGCDT